MRIGVFHNKPYYLRFCETILRTLLDRGHELLLARPDRYDSVKAPRSLRDGRVSTALYPHLRTDGLQRTVEVVRVARGAVRYLSPELRATEASRRRAFEQLAHVLSDGSRAAFEPPPIEWTDHERAALTNVFEEIERLIPADPAMVSFFEEHGLDLAVCISRVNIGGRQTEVLKAAATLGIPAAVVVYSWDNLSNKGLLHVQPDRLLVWNDIQVREAVELQGVDEDRVVAVGAARFDGVFARIGSMNRADLLAGLGLAPDRATVLYVGSSRFVAPREPEFISRWISAIRSSSDERLRSANVIVRPHPGVADAPVWQSWSPSDEGVAVAKPVHRAQGQDLLDQISASDAVVALNTSAELEAAILGKPVLTVRAGAFAPGQEGQLHFHYLLADHGGYVQAASTLEEHAAALASALAADPGANARRDFLERFLRPRGIDTPVGPLLADELERLGRGRPQPPDGVLAQASR